MGDGYWRGLATRVSKENMTYLHTINRLKSALFWYQMGVIMLLGALISVLVV